MLGVHPAGTALSKVFLPFRFDPIRPHLKLRINYQNQKYKGTPGLGAARLGTARPGAVRLGAAQHQRSLGVICAKVFNP